MKTECPLTCSIPVVAAYTRRAWKRRTASFQRLPKPISTAPVSGPGHRARTAVPFPAEKVRRSNRMIAPIPCPWDDPVVAISRNCSTFIPVRDPAPSFRALTIGLCPRRRSAAISPPLACFNRLVHASVTTIATCSARTSSNPIPRHLTATCAPRRSGCLLPVQSGPIHAFTYSTSTSRLSFLRQVSRIFRTRGTVASIHPNQDPFRCRMCIHR